jgi:quercetin dioxygenase-like cupin family protein
VELEPLTPTAKAPAANFTGDVYVNQVHPPREPSRLIAGYVRFTPGARTNWHSHASARPWYAPTAPGWS